MPDDGAGSAMMLHTHLLLYLSVWNNLPKRISWLCEKPSELSRETLHLSFEEGT